MKKIIKVIDSDIFTSYEAQRLYCIARKKTFETTETSATATIFIPDENKKYIFTQTHDKVKILGLLARVKKEILECKIAAEPQRIDYFGCKNVDTKEIVKDCYEVDITSAYINIAYQTGYIREALKNEICKLKKADRLKVLGRIASRKDVRKYVDGVEIEFEMKQPTKEEIYLRDVWFDISARTDNMIKEMIKIIGEDDYLFYYVDAIFVKSKTAAKIINDYLLFFKFGCKIKRINILRIKSTEKGHQITTFTKNYKVLKKIKKYFIKKRVVKWIYKGNIAKK